MANFFHFDEFAKMWVWQPKTSCWVYCPKSFFYKFFCKWTEHYQNFLCTCKLIFPLYLLIATCLYANFSDGPLLFTYILYINAYMYQVSKESLCLLYSRYKAILLQIITMQIFLHCRGKGCYARLARFQKYILWHHACKMKGCCNFYSGRADC